MALQINNKVNFALFKIAINKCFNNSTNFNYMFTFTFTYF